MGRGLLNVSLCFLLAAPVFADLTKDQQKSLTDAIKRNNSETIREALVPIVANGGSEGAEFLCKTLEKMAKSSDNAYWQLVNAATSFNDTAAMEALGDYLAKKKKTALARDLLFALQNNHSTAATAAHAKVLEKGADDMKPLAVDQLAAIESEVSVDVLITAFLDLKKNDPLAERIERALRVLTGADCGTAEDWQKWWDISRADGLQGHDASFGSGGTVTGDLDPSRAGEFAGLETLAPEKIIVLKAECARANSGCNFDSIENVLENMGIPHTVMSRQEFEEDLEVLGGAMALVLNCVQISDHCVCPNCKANNVDMGMRLNQCTGCDTHDIINHALSGKAAKAIGQWVDAGGYLFSEDWGLIDVLSIAWPGLVGAGKMLGDQETPAQPMRGMTANPLFRGVFTRSGHQKINDYDDEGDSGDGETVEREADMLTEVLGVPEHFWTIDDESPAIKVKNPKVVLTLLRSEELRDESDGDEAVAITFQPRGKRGGAVLHVLSHFGKQESEVDEYAMQNLLLNFLLEARRGLNLD